MPEGPKKGESSKAWVSKCIAHCVKNEGLSQEQAAGKCYGMLRQHRGNKALGPKKG